ncbi:MAG TPA: WG repeat-containing protein [Ohtaekwangia sp.]|nr:WG repeat-containing protein [Ohtaekwangia sp.]
MKRYRSLIITLLISFSSVAQAYIVFEENGKTGLKDGQGKILIPAIYDAIGWSKGNFSIVNNVTGYKLNDRWGLISIDNKKITTDQFAELQPVEGGLILARKMPAYSQRLATGCINTTGKEIIPFVYDGIKINSLRAIVFTKIGNQYRHGLIDLNNKTLIPQQFQDIRSIGTLRYAVRNFEGKTALYAETGVRITDFTIDSLSEFTKDHAIVYQGKYRGLVDRNGVMKVPAKYSDIVVQPNGTVKTREADEWIVLNGQNKTIRTVRADSINALAKNLLELKTNNEAILTDQSLKPITSAVYSDVSHFIRNKAIYRLGDYYGVITKNGSVVVPALYHKIIIGNSYIFADQSTAGKKVWMLFDSAGARLTDKGYEAIQPLPFGFAVKQRDAWGIINHAGIQKVACAYDSIIQNNGAQLVVKFKGLYGIIDLKEDWKVSPRKNRLHVINEDRYIEYSPTSTLLKSMNGTVIYFTTNRIEIFADHLLEYLPSGNIWQIDMSGVIENRQVIPAEATEEIYEASEGYRAIKRNGRFGFIDAKGRLRIANRYEAVRKFSDGYAAIKILGKWGFVNQQDNIAVQPVYDDVMPFKEGYALVQQNGLSGLIDKTGKQVLPVRYNNIEALPTKNLLVELNGLKGLSDGSGKMLIHPKYTLINDVGNGFVIVERDGKYGVITDQGISTIPLIYDLITYDRFHDVFFAQRKSEWVEVRL